MSRDGMAGEVETTRWAIERLTRALTIRVAVMLAALGAVHIGVDFLGR